MTKGEYRVGINFNPSNDDTVGRIKSMAAALIDFIEGIEAPTVPDDFGGDVYLASQASEINRLKALAQTHVEDAAMWAVKAATKPAPAN